MNCSQYYVLVVVILASCKNDDNILESVDLSGTQSVLATKLHPVSNAVPFIIWNWMPYKKKVFITFNLKNLTFNIKDVLMGNRHFWLLLTSITLI